MLLPFQLTNLTCRKTLPPAAAFPKDYKEDTRGTACCHNTSYFPLPALCGTKGSRKSLHFLTCILRASETGGGSAMTFEELLDQAITLLQRRGRLTYRALKRQFNLDDDYLEDLKAELIQGQRLAVDEDGAVLVWTG